VGGSSRRAGCARVMRERCPDRPVWLGLC
jgi:hypothetical protein